MISSATARCLSASVFIFDRLSKPKRCTSRSVRSMTTSLPTVISARPKPSHQCATEAFVGDLHKGHRHLSAFLLDQHGDGVMEGLGARQRHLVGVADGRNRALLFLAQHVAGEDCRDRLAVPLAVAVERAGLAQHFPDEVGALTKSVR